MAEKKKTTKAKSTKKAGSLLPKKEAKKEEPKEKVYSFQELANMFGISDMKARAYFNMCQLDYGDKITIKQARELLKTGKFTLIDIKPDKTDPDEKRSVFVFKYENGIEEYLK